MINHTRSRWAAIGAAIAVTLGAGGIGITHATTDSGPMPIFKPLDAPCRLADTRPDPNTVGPRTTGIGPAETYDLDGWGTVGNCVLPSDTAALQLNVTAVGATEQTNLRFFPKGAAVPTTANLNPSPGAGATPNSVVVGLNDSDGQFSVFNAFGTVAVIIDVIGYFDDHVHGSEDIIDNSLTGDDIQNSSITNIDTSNEPGIVFNSRNTSFSLTGPAETVVSTFIRVPSDGFVNVQVSGRWNPAAASSTANCQIQKGSAAAIDLSEPWIDLGDPGNDTGFRDFSAHRTIDISVDDNPTLITSGQVLSLVCDETAGTVTLDDLHITATFYATSYSPFFIIIPLDEEG